MAVYLGSRDAGRGEDATRSLIDEGLDVIPLRLDVTDNESVESAVAELRRVHGRLDVLVNNAGVLVSRAAFAITADDMKDTYDTNVFGVVRMIHATLGLLQSSVAPRIVNVASTTASLTLSSDGTTMFGQEDTIVAYASSKAAVTMLTVQYANAFRRSSPHAHIKINAATPGYIATDLNNHSGNRTVEQGSRIIFQLATLHQDGPSGGFFNDAGRVAW
jgi:NAD(P)-dependent dehydrogenase (short-subunit alcohol dehydrogenase family)